MFSKEELMSMPFYEMVLNIRVLEAKNHALESVNKVQGMTAQEWQDNYRLQLDREHMLITDFTKEIQHRDRLISALQSRADKQANHLTMLKKQVVNRENERDRALWFAIQEKLKGHSTHPATADERMNNAN